MKTTANINNWKNFERQAESTFFNLFEANLANERRKSENTKSI